MKLILIFVCIRSSLSGTRGISYQCFWGTGTILQIVKLFLRHSTNQKLHTPIC